MKVTKHFQDTSLIHREMSLHASVKGKIAISAINIVSVSS